MQKMGLTLFSHMWVVSTDVFVSGFCIGGFHLGYLVGAIIMEGLGNEFILFCFILVCLLYLMSISKEVLLSFYFF